MQSQSSRKSYTILGIDQVLDVNSSGDSFFGSLSFALNSIDLNDLRWTLISPHHFTLVAIKLHGPSNRSETWNGSHSIAVMKYRDLKQFTKEVYFGVWFRMQNLY